MFLECTSSKALLAACIVIYILLLHGGLRSDQLFRLFEAIIVIVRFEFIISLRLLLFFDKLRIEAVGEVFDQVIMVTLLHNLTLLHNYDVVSMANGGQTMCYHHGGDRSEVSTNLVNCSLNFFFVLFIKGTSRFIKEKDLRTLDKGACNCNTLLLASRKLSSSISYICVNAIFSHLFIDKVPCIGRF
jgi:hypothetical protein